MRRSSYRCATHQAGRPRPAVDINFTTMPILARSTSNTRRIVFWPHSINPAIAHPVTHQLNKIRPQPLPLISPKHIARLQRIQLVPKQHLSAIDVANPDQH
jgi:hypothetical protein